MSDCLEVYNSRLKRLRISVGKSGLIFLCNFLGPRIKDVEPWYLLVRVYDNDSKFDIF